jgi:tetratricopeptide (TPR) repeat protein
VRRRPRAIALLLRATALAALLSARHAAASPPEGARETAEHRKAAAKLFQEGQRAFHAGDFQRAAEAFEQAYEQAPRPAPLWNAARAWHRAGEPVRAANLYADYLRVAPPNAPDRASALAAMKELEPRLGRLEIHAEGFDELTLDGAKVASSTVFVSPGVHVVEARKHGKLARERPRLEAGATLSLALVEPEDEPPPPLPPPPPPAPEPPRGLSPVYTAVGGGLFVLGAGLTVWSGLDTLEQKKSFDALPTQRNLDEGRSRESRTNLLLLATGGVAVATAAVAVFFTDWGPGRSGSPQVGVGPGSVVIRGGF